MKNKDFISLADAAELVMLTPRRVQQLTAEGFIEKTAGKYTVTGVVQGYVRYLQDEARRTSKSAASSRVTDRRADEIELRILEKKGTLTEAARNEALDIVDAVIGGLKADIYAVPARAAKADLSMRRKIEEEIDDAFKRSAKRAQNCAAGLDPDHDLT